MARLLLLAGLVGLAGTAWTYDQMNTWPMDPYSGTAGANETQGRFDAYDGNQSAPGTWEPPLPVPRRLPLLDDQPNLYASPGDDLGGITGQDLYAPSPYSGAPRFNGNSFPGQTPGVPQGNGWSGPGRIGPQGAYGAPLGDDFDQFPNGIYNPNAPVPRGALDHRDLRFRPEGMAEGPPYGRPRFPQFDDGSGFAEPPATAFPNYRFRGDSAPQGNWQNQPYDSLYRFRPLNERDLGRLEQGSRYRPTAPSGASGVAPPPVPALPPGATYGFEPNPWSR